MKKELQQIFQAKSHVILDDIIHSIRVTVESREGIPVTTREDLLQLLDIGKPHLDSIIEYLVKEEKESEDIC
ncbi:MAG: hypothetical protein RL662_176 [Bacteroidota bacterium]